jgi:hypothetical protein
MTATNAITAVQDAYVKKVIDTLNDLPNVLWIVSQEAPRNSVWWNRHLITLTRTYEAGKPLQHPIGLGVLEDNNDATISNSDADWIAPAARIFPITHCDSSRSPCKVIINDSDHSYFGMWNDSSQVNRRFFWINFTNGHQTLFMDPYVVYYPREKRNLCPSPVNGIGSGPDGRWDHVRDTMGYIRGYAERMDLAATAPHPELASTKHCLTQPGHEYLLYLPDGGATTVDLSAAPAMFLVEWMNPSDGKTSSAEAITGGAKRTLKAPFKGDAVLYLKKR